MVKINSFSITLDGGKIDYVSGDIVAGHADMEITEGNLEITCEHP